MSKASARLQPRWPDRLAATMLRRRRGGRRARGIRRALAFALLITAGAVALSGRQGPVAGIRVLAILRDLPAGASLRQTDLTTLTLASVPDGALRSPPQAVGRLLAAPVRKGEVLTDVRLVSTAGPAAGPGRVAVPIRPADPGTVDLLSPGVHVTVLSVAEDGRATVLAADAVVLTIPPPSKADPERPLVVLSVPSDAANRLTAAAITGAVVMRFA